MRTMPVRVWLLLVFWSGAAFASPQHVQQSWHLRPTAKSPYRATLTEDTYNFGESNRFSLRIDASPSNGDNGWFYEGPLEAGGAVHAPKPELVWTSSTDLLVTVHTAELEGKTVRRFGGNGRPRGSVTIRYIPHGPSIY
ncbi:hypothetical protein [Sphingomonas flavescens]|uniref:hypothetical protein n=1 Tax=Sphingomonas flavescens TaxID=3132797 RepID=UPI00280555B9|nr:hypothetical protein [Sphingomonas limnosediminicola]